MVVGVAQSKTQLAPEKEFPVCARCGVVSEVQKEGDKVRLFIGLSESKDVNCTDPKIGMAGDLTEALVDASKTSQFGVGTRVRLIGSEVSVAKKGCSFEGPKK